MFEFIRGFRSSRDPRQWSTASVNPLQNVTPITPVPDTKVPQITVDTVNPLQTPFHIRTSSKWTQADQDSYDEEARHQARESLTQSWKDRLSAISLITTFFAATEAQLLSTTASGVTESKLGHAVNAGLVGALVIHSFAAIISFLAAFFLISYTINEARHELKFEFELERADSSSSNGHHHHHHHVRERSVMKNDTRIVQICRFDNSLPPTQLLERCTNLCMLLTAAGFVMEIMAILCFAWDKTGVGVSSAATGLTLFCLVASLIVMRPAAQHHVLPHGRSVSSRS